MSVTATKKPTTWSKEEISRLKRLIGNNTPTSFMSLLMGRSSAAIRAQASRLKVSLKEDKKTKKKEE